MQGGKGGLPSRGGVAPHISTFGLFLIAGIATAVIQLLVKLSLYLVCPGLAAFFSLAGPMLSRTASTQDLWYAGASSGTAWTAMHIGFWIAELSLFRRRDEDSEEEQRRLKDPSQGNVSV